jgi:hypothetical protein
MKLFFGISAAAAAAFFFMALQTGVFGPRRFHDDEDGVEVKEAKVKKAPVTRAKFPEDLAPAARAKPVPAAAEYKFGNPPHKFAVLKVNGALHPWHTVAVDDQEDWTATNVEETELVLVLSNQTKTIIEHVTFANGPPVDREKWELEASIVEVKTGKVLANRRFINLPRAIQAREAYELTMLGAPVHFHTVFNWATRQAKNGFVPNPNAEPITTVEERQ